MTLSPSIRGTLLLVATLVAGFGLGILFDRMHLQPHHVISMDGFNLPHGVMKRFHDELGLDSAQTAAIQAILARHQSQVDSSWRALQPQVQASMASAHNEIVAVLRPDQVEKLRGMLRSMDIGPGMRHLRHALDSSGH